MNKLNAHLTASSIFQNYFNWVLTFYREKAAKKAINMVFVIEQVIFGILLEEHRISLYIHKIDIGNLLYFDGNIIFRQNKKRDTV